MKSCVTCKFCTVPENSPVSMGKCSAVCDPVTGKPMSPMLARCDTYTVGGASYTLPCGYEGKRWVGK